MACLEKAKFKLNALYIIPLPADQRYFTNPITKRTFDSLPKIYGRRKKKKYLLKYNYEWKRPRQCLLLDNTKCHELTHPKDAISETTPGQKVFKLTDKHNDTILKRYKTEAPNCEINDKLSKPKSNICTHKYCCCYNYYGYYAKYHHVESKSQLKRASFKDKRYDNKVVQSSQLEVIRLPKIHRYNQNREMCYHESSHKVQGYRNWTTAHKQITQSASFGIQELIRGRVKQARMGYEDVELLENSRNGSMKSIPKANGKYSSRLSIDQPQQLSSRNGYVDNNQPKAEEFVPVNHDNSIVHLTDTSQDDANYNPLPVLNEAAKNYTEYYGNLFDSRTIARPALHPYFASESDNDERQSVSSISSATISKYVFADTRKNTMFSSLKKRYMKLKASNKRLKEVNEEKEVYVYDDGKKYKYIIEGKKEKEKEKKYMGNKNSLFVIPYDEELIEYLKDYYPMGQKFKIKYLVRRPNFKVLKAPNSVYFGYVKDYLKHGEGLMISYQEIFEGKFEKDVKIVGYYRNIDGVYKGEFLNGLREGYGTFEWNNGETFEGEWRNGTKNGLGIWRSPNGGFYYGEWVMNRQHGKGVFKNRLSTYRGTFEHFLKSGYGYELFTNGDKYVGSYRYGKPHGKGRYNWADGSIYEGYFLAGVRYGHGRWYMANGTIYYGNFHNDFKHGHGKYIYKSGEYYEGYFHEGIKSKGQLHDNKGSIIDICTD